MKHLMRTASPLSIALALAAAAACPATAADVSLTPAVSQTSGRYGSDTVTSITTTSLTGALDTDDWTFKLTIPYLIVRGDAGVVPGLGSVGQGQGGFGRRRENNSTVSGLGDVTATAIYTAYENEAGDLSIDLTGKVKFGTASRDLGLGTGANDYTAAIDLYKSYAALTVLGGMGYTVVGNAPDLALNNVYSVTIGASYKTGTATRVGLMYDGRQAYSATSGELSEATLYLRHKGSASWRSQVFVLKGFAAGSPDWGLGASLTRQF